MTKTIMITGATDGIGLLTAKTLSNAECAVLLHGRSSAKLEAAATEMSGPVSTYIADLSDLAAVKTMAAAVKAEHETVDVLINNAGVLKTSNAILSNGQDIRFVVNTLAPYVLTDALLPVIPRDGRVINLSSAAQAPVDVAAMRKAPPMDDMTAYAQSKLAITIWSQDMARRHPDGPVVIPVNPGSLLASKMVKEGFGIAGNDLSIGADILCRLALDEEFADASGRYWDNDARGFGRPHAAAANPAHVAEVMAAIEELT